DLAQDARLSDNAGRVQHESEIDQAIEAWTRKHTSTDVLYALREAEVPTGPIYSVEDMFNDPHYRARDVFEKVQVQGRDMEIPAIHPKLQDTPGRTDSAGPDVGQHTDAVLQQLLQLSSAEVDALKAAQAV
ncbi:MAG: CoA transferase, partial [Pseudomonadota bacterium]